MAGGGGMARVAALRYASARCNQLITHRWSGGGRPAMGGGLHIGNTGAARPSHLGLIPSLNSRHFRSFHRLSHSSRLRT